MAFNRWRCLTATVSAGILVSVACGDEGTGPSDLTREDITRTFTASTFTISSGGAVADQLALGANLGITLLPDGTTTGTLFIPGAAEGGGDLSADLGGTFAFDDTRNRVTFEQTADTFVRDMTFEAARVDGTVQLEGQESFGGTVVHLVLRSSPS